VKPLDCGGCRACCLREQIELRPELGDDPARYETEERDGRIFIAAKPGSRACRYLGPAGCTIYADRPAACRAFDCRVYYLQKTHGMNRGERRRFDATNPLPHVFKEARKRL